MDEFGHKLTTTGTTRPPGYPADEWKRLNVTQRERAITEFREAKEGHARSSGDTHAGLAVPPVALDADAPVAPWRPRDSHDDPPAPGPRGSGHPVVNDECEIPGAASPLSFDVRSQEITSDEGDDHSQAAWEADREEFLSRMSIERASRFPIGPVPIPDEHEQGFPAMSIKVGKRPTHRYRAARPWIPNALAVRPMTRMEARASEGALRGHQCRVDQIAQGPRLGRVQGEGLD